MVIWVNLSFGQIGRFAVVDTGAGTQGKLAILPFHSLGIDYVVNPQDITSNMIIEKIQMVPIGTYLKLKTEDIEILRLKANKQSSVTGKSLRQLDKSFKKSIIVGAIVRKDKVIIPWGDLVINENDEAIMLCNREHNDRVKKLFSG